MADKTIDQIDDEKLVPDGTDELRVWSDGVLMRSPVSAIYDRSNHTGSSCDLEDDSVTNVKLADVPENTVKGAVISGSPDDLVDSETAGVVNVEIGADVTDASNVSAAGAAMLNAVNAFEKQFRHDIGTPFSKATTPPTGTVDWDLDYPQGVLSLTESSVTSWTVNAPSNMKDGGRYAMILSVAYQGASISWNGAFQFANGGSPEVSEGGVWIIDFVSDGSSMYGLTLNDMLSATHGRNDRRFMVAGDSDLLVGDVVGSRGSFAGGYLKDSSSMYASWGSVFAYGTSTYGPSKSEAIKGGIAFLYQAGQSSHAHKGAFVHGRGLGTGIGANRGAFAGGGGGYAAETISASGKGAFLHMGSGNKFTNVIASGVGSFGVIGSAGSYSSARISGNGAFAVGLTGDTGLGEQPSVSGGRGSMITGWYGRAIGDGSCVFGHSPDYKNEVKGDGSFLFTTSSRSSDISLTTKGAFQVGEGIRLLSSPPISPRNGDVWQANNYVYIRSNGTSVKK